MPSKDPEKRAAHNRAYYERNKQDRLRRNEEVRKRNFAYTRDIKENTPCADCGVQYPYYVMDFDHLGDKVADVSKMCNNLVSLETLQAEIDKCELVCANCHRIRTFNRNALVA